MTAVKTIARRHSLLVLEDCAQAHGARFQGEMAGSMSDAAAFSFYPTKILGAYGDGGMVITDDGSVKDKLRRLRFYGMENTYYAEDHGYNSRLDELHAEILRRKLRHLDKYIARRRQLAFQYDQALADSGLILPAVEEGNDHAYYLYVVRHKHRDEVISRLKEQEIFVNISYPWPIHMMRAYADLGYKQGDLPQTETAAKEIFSLPMYPTLTDEEQDMVCEALKDILEEM
jgi:aminotransferase EvaB